MEQEKNAYPDTSTYILLSTDEKLGILNRLNEGQMEEWHSIYSYKNILALYKMYIKSRNYIKKAYFT